jgi:2-polyprenyl-6-methoxyphenol hydroxylase-like FAD-dependent oxidoreductase
VTAGALPHRLDAPRRIRRDEHDGRTVFPPGHVTEDVEEHAMDRPLQSLRGEPLRITILGAGIAGLAAATLLARTGHRVELLDERFAVPAVGTVLGLFRPAQEVLRELGVLEAAQQLAAAPERGTLRAADGRVLADLPSPGALLLSRSVLVRLLQEALPTEVRTETRRIQDVRPLRDRSDLLIGADGVHSLVRRSGWPGRTAARSHGMTVLRGTTDAPRPRSPRPGAAAGCSASRRWRGSGRTGSPASPSIAPRPRGRASSTCAPWWAGTVP